MVETHLCLWKAIQNHKKRSSSWKHNKKDLAKENNLNLELHSLLEQAPIRQQEETLGICDQID
jgi:hypothetical protein